MVQRLHESDEALRDKRVLVVDDDVRNIFALSSVLERHGMSVITAGTGQEAIEKVAEDADIDLVLMDIMMPGMDGYDTMRAIRSDPESRALPIVALTAKAMKGDREKCLEAGASDYLAKPVATADVPDHRGRTSATDCRVASIDGHFSHPRRRFLRPSRASAG
jgi:CheY-like chemotaxis protein